MELTEETTEEIPTKSKKKFVHPKKKPDERKKDKEARRLRKARVIVRNISFKSTPENLQAEFSKYGPVTECNILKRADGKLVGCAFVQFEKVNHAAKAIHHGNAKEFLGRPVAIDWAVNQKHFANHLKKKRNNNSNNHNNNNTNKEEDTDDEDVSIKSEPESDISDEDDSDTLGTEGYDDDSDENDGSDDEDELEDSKVGIKTELDEDDKKSVKKIKNDVVEGCTVFIKNVPFRATNDDLYKVCRQFGQIKYALITIDKISGHSKGTGFVKYKAKESADMCLNSGTSFKLLDQILDPHPALSRHDAKDKQESTKKKEPIDSRNLFLAKEGLITTGTPAAEGVSQSDMAKRVFLEQSKGQLLKDLNRFVSKERLTVHNIPPTFDDARLRKVVEKVTKLKPKECRIMRENKPSMGQPLGKSKGYAFLSFKSHNEALLCLRRLNNCPEAFGKNNRPIVSFSIEDRAVHNLKMKRLQKSREKNPTFKSKIEKRKEKRLKRKEKNPDVKPKFSNGINERKPVVTKPEEELPAFSGAIAEKGSQLKARPKWQMREDLATHNKETKEKKKVLKKQRELDNIRQEKRQIERPKQGKKREIDSSLVNKYLNMLHSKDERNGPKPPKRSKWYVE